MSKFQVFLCDDVRKEDNGKYIAVGMYTEGVGAESLPVRISLCLMVIISEVGEGTKTLNIAVVTKKNELDNEIRHFEFGSGRAGRASVWFNSVPVETEVETKIEIYCSIDDEEIRLIDAIPLTVFNEDQETDQT